MELASQLRMWDLRRLVVRAAYVALLGLAVVLPRVSSNGFEFPGISHGWVLLVFAALMVIALLEGGPLLRLRYLDALVLVVPALALALEHRPRQWPILLLYAAFVYLAARMLMIARSNAEPGGRGDPLVPRSWLIAGLFVLALVHIGWAWQSSVTNDSAQGAAQGATRVLEGRSVYGSSATIAAAPHGDVYGPVLYEAYTPFTGKIAGRPADRLLGAVAELLCALLLFILGRRLGGRATGTLLAFCWLAYPLTLYEDGLGFNDGLVAAALLGAVLVSRSPARRGAMSALAAWLKLTPLALVPVLALYRPAGGQRKARIARFAAGFALVTGIVFAPVLLHDTPATFLDRTLGFQGTREPADSLWSSLEVGYGYALPWLASAARIAHGLVVAGAAALALFAPRLLRRNDELGLAAISAAILIAVQMGLSYYAYGYVLWFAPLVLVGLFAGVRQRERAPGSVAVPPGMHAVAGWRTTQRSCGEGFP